MLDNEVLENSFSFSENGNFVIFFVLGPTGSSGAETWGTGAHFGSLPNARREASYSRNWGGLFFFSVCVLASLGRRLSFFLKGGGR